MSISKQSFSYYKIKSGLYLNISESTYTIIKLILYQGKSHIRKFF